MRSKFEAMRTKCETKPHGTRQRYIFGCRCVPCRAANSRYETHRALARAQGDWNGLVDATPARRHLARLARAGVGRHAVRAASGVSDSILQPIITGERKRIRARTERRILAVGEAARAGGALVDARYTWRLLDELVRDGYTKTQLARWLGSQAAKPALQLRRDRITFRSASLVERLYCSLLRGELARAGERLRLSAMDAWRNPLAPPVAAWNYREDGA